MDSFEPFGNEGAEPAFKVDTSVPAEVSVQSSDFERLAVGMQFWGVLLTLLGLGVTVAALTDPASNLLALLASLNLLALGIGFAVMGWGFANYQLWAWLGAVALLLPATAVVSLLAFWMLLLGGSLLHTGMCGVVSLYVFYVAWVLLSRGGRRRYFETVAAYERALADPESTAGKVLARRTQAARGRRQMALVGAGIVGLCVLSLMLLSWASQPTPDPPAFRQRLVDLPGHTLVDQENRVTNLRLNGPLVTDAALEELEGLDRLVQFDVEQTAITDATLARLAKLRRLKYVDLTGTRITDAGLAHLTSAPLEELLLGDTSVTDAALEQIVRMKRLQRLELRNTAVTDAGLARLGEVKTLRKLSVRGTQVTEAGIADLKRALPLPRPR